jgi:hypothetical protein
MGSKRQVAEQEACRSRLSRKASNVTRYTSRSTFFKKKKKISICIALQLCITGKTRWSLTAIDHLPRDRDKKTSHTISCCMRVLT